MCHRNSWVRQNTRYQEAMRLLKWQRMPFSYWFVLRLLESTYIHLSNMNFGWAELPFYLPD